MADDIATALAGQAPIGRLTALEQRWSWELLVEATRVAVMRPVWRLPGDEPAGLVTGSGGVGYRLPNVSTLAALTASCAPGVRVVKPGSRSSRSKDVGPGGLAARVGLPVADSPAAVSRALAGEQFALLDTDHLYPWLRLPEVFTVPYLAEAMHRASFLPCSAVWKVNGVVEPDVGVHVERCRGSEVSRTLVVRGSTDLPDFVIDDVSTCGTTSMISISEATYETWSVEPEDVGLPRVAAADLIVARSTRVEELFAAILLGDAPASLIQLVAMSAGAVLLQAGAVDTLAEGCATGLELLGSGVVAAKLSRLRQG
ncbi:hypothetical protein [Micromonospora sagamiensis]|uniref:hypothetical protein n=1 Tax=Micromonospora sagamiensis TaxID=47875 RepID=UPI0011A969C4|nr:hypothetical protein [Micromonospora sagamiensis]